MSYKIVSLLNGLPLDAHRQDMDSWSRRDDDPKDLAEALVKHYNSMGPLSKEERDTLERSMARRSRHVPLTPDELSKIARLSFRQLRRLNKQRMPEDDRVLVKAVQGVKETLTKMR
jgi:hypothetical protein